MTRQLLPGEQPDGSWVLDPDEDRDIIPARSLMAAAVAEFRVRNGLPHEEPLPVSGETFTTAAEEDAQLDRVSKVLAACIGHVEDHDLEEFRVGVNALYLTAFTVEQLRELRQIAREEASLEPDLS
jgi:hypothetical protein